jgi:hypothetical protein
VVEAVKVASSLKRVGGLLIRNSPSPLGEERRLPIGPGKGKKRNKEPLKPATGCEYT